MTEPVLDSPQPEVVAPKPKKTAVVVLAVLAVLLLGATGTFGALYFVERKASTELAQQKDREVADLTKKAKNSEDEATKARIEKNDFETRAKLTEKCTASAKAFKEAMFSDDRAKEEAAAAGFLLNCN